MDTLSHFSRTYAEARDKFNEAAAAQSLPLEAHVLPGYRGIDGEELAIDTAVLGEGSADAVLVLTSATHGIEGYCGSGVQIGFLREPEIRSAAVEASVQLLFIHALNPHGFSHARRVNEDNVDLNRNFCDYGKPLPVNAAYADIHALLLPATWPPAMENEAKIGAYVATNGERVFQTAVTGGQYAFPDGLFFGGTRATWSNRTLRSILAKHGANRRRIGWIDFHTGLGPRGHGEKIFAGRNDPREIARARDWWGSEVTSIYDGSSSSAELTGLLCNAAYEECPGAEYTGIALEYGTLPLRDMLEALRGDHWLAQHPEAPEAQRGAIRQRMRDAFYVDAPDWKEAVYAQARAAALRAIAKLSARA